MVIFLVVFIVLFVAAISVMLIWEEWGHVNQSCLDFFMYLGFLCWWVWMSWSWLMEYLS